MKIEGQCKLCGQASELVKSHIIPNWAFKALKDDSGRILKINSQGHKRVSIIGTGEWDRFLCDSCEARLQDLDEYGRAVIFSQSGQPTFGIETQPASHGVDILNVDYKRLKLFQLSVLWRASVTKREFFDEIALKENEPVIKKMLVNRDPGEPSDFGCMMTAVRFEPNEMLIKLVDSPFMRMERKWNIASFFYGGCVWQYLVHQDAVDFPLSQFFATPHGPLPISIEDLQNLPGLRRRLEWLRDTLGDDSGRVP